ncbi:MAG: HD domain-containing phosphohydrolase, partial [Planctomycetota bacterium]
MSGDTNILIVDDMEAQRALLEAQLEELGYDAETASDGFEAMAKMKTGFDLVLLDAQMPGMAGFEVAEKIRGAERCEDVIIVMVTGHDSQEDKERAQDTGLNGFISKPVDIDDLETTLYKWLGATGGKGKSEIAGVSPEGPEEKGDETGAFIRDLTHAKREAYSAQIETLERLAIAAEYRDAQTGKHVRRVGALSALLAEKLHLRPGQVEILNYSSQLHDVGKIGIPDSILLKNGPLGDEEWRTMRKHPEIGGKILEGSSSKFLQSGKEISLTHQEKWDGSGYPRGLRGKNIPLSGRICAVVDVFDALTSDRPYRDAFPVEEALAIMEDGRGEHFDPE